MPGPMPFPELRTAFVPIGAAGGPPATPAWPPTRTPGVPTGVPMVWACAAAMMPPATSTLSASVETIDLFIAASRLIGGDGVERVAPRADRGTGNGRRDAGIAADPEADSAV